mmetsp:Transcript_798/g.4992  ORF Transcript_798/g.4992 Transcript_798/m.4992 type:complete len:122 (+) Transcript_798:1953-2318(+)
MRHRTSPVFQSTNLPRSSWSDRLCNPCLSKLTFSASSSEINTTGMLPSDLWAIRKCCQTKDSPFYCWFGSVNPQCTEDSLGHLGRCEMVECGRWIQWTNVLLVGVIDGGFGECNLDIDECT